MKKALKFLLNFIITLIICYLSLPVAGFIIAFIFEFIVDIQMLNTIFNGFIHLLNPLNTVLMRFLLIVSSVIALVFACKNRNIIK